MVEMTRFHVPIALAVTMAPVLASTLAHADGPQLIAHTTELLIDDGGRGSAQIPVHPEHATYIEMPSKIRAYHTPERTPKFKVQDNGNRLRVRSLDNATMGDKLSLYVETDAAEHLNLLFFLTDKADVNESLIVVRRRSEAERRQAEVDEEVARQMAARQSDTLKALTLQAHQRRDGDVRVPLHPAISTDAVYARFLRSLAVASDAGSGKGSTYLTFEVVNNSPFDYPVAAVDVFAADMRQKARAEIICVGDVPECRDGNSDLITTVYAGTRLQATVRVPDELEGELHRLSLQIAAPGGLQPLMLAAQEWVLPEGKTYYPKMTREQALEYERIRRQEEQRQERLRRDEMERGRVTLHLQAVGGAIWLPSPMDTDELAATSVQGLGMRATYGFTTALAFEGEIVGARTGEASFDGGMSRSASLMRVQVGGALRFGEKIVPLVRLGVGLQVGMTEAQMPDSAESAFAASVPFTVGIGVDYRLGSTLLLGIGATATGALQGSNDASKLGIEAGMHLGYSWRP
jgi:hypothetical protein